jgi:PAS domain S-box-containing protein
MRDPNLGRDMELLDYIQKRGDRFDFCITLADADAEDQPLIYVNKIFADFTGYAREEAIGRNCRFLQNGQSDPEVRRHIREALAQHRPICADLRNFKKSGEEFFNRLVLLPFSSKQRRLYLGLQHAVPATMIQKSSLEDELEILDRTVNPLSVMMGRELRGITEEDQIFRDSVRRLRDFVLQGPRSGSAPD